MENVNVSSFDVTIALSSNVFNKTNAANKFVTYILTELLLKTTRNVTIICLVSFIFF